MRPGGDADYENSAGTETRQPLNSTALQHPANPPSPAPRLSTTSNQALNVGFRVHAGRYWVPTSTGKCPKDRGGAGTRTLPVLCSNRGKRRRNPGSCSTLGVLPPQRLSANRTANSSVGGTAITIRRRCFGLAKLTPASTTTSSPTDTERYPDGNSYRHTDTDVAE